MCIPVTEMCLLSRKPGDCDTHGHNYIEDLPVTANYVRVVKAVSIPVGKAVAVATILIIFTFRSLHDSCRGILHEILHDSRRK